MKCSEEALKFLNLGIESEIAAYVFYRKASGIVGDGPLRKIIDKLAMDEKGHFLALENEYDENVRSECWAPYKDILSTNWCRGRTRSFSARSRSSKAERTSSPWRFLLKRRRSTFSATPPPGRKPRT